jgi:hypothetical protein
MRLSLLFLFTLAAAGCGQIASTASDSRDPSPQAPASSSPAPAAPPDMAPSSTAAPAPTLPPPAGACGVVASPRAFSTPDDQAVALHGLWVSCATDPAPGLCPASDTSMFFGALDAQSDRTSRAVACGHVTTHGDGFIANPAYTFTYEVTDLAPSGSPPTYLLHVTNATSDRTFVLTYRDDMAMTGSVNDGTITLGEPDGRVGALRHSAFTTF